jgi:hypothetical protein
MGLVNDHRKGPSRRAPRLPRLDPADTYYIGADVAMGVRGGDYSVAQVLDSKKRQVAVWRGHVHPDHFATVLAALGYYYNTARIAVEATTTAS